MPDIDMRIWDIHPGQLNRQSLLGEHRELHGICSILQNGKKGYAHHPESLRWVNHLPALCQRHQALVREMTLRGYRHQSPLVINPHEPISGPEKYIDEPIEPRNPTASRSPKPSSNCGRNINIPSWLVIPNFTRNSGRN